MAELFDVCDANAIDFQITAQMDNPATINSELKDFDMRIAEGGVLLASTRVSGFALPPGSVRVCVCVSVCLLKIIIEQY